MNRKSVNIFTKQFAPALFVSLIFVGCAEPDITWLDSEKENAQHLFYSLESSIAATVLSNEIGQGRKPKDAMKVVVSLRKTALKEARLVQDSVLYKANQELPDKFRNLYQQSLEQFIKGYEEKDNQALIRYSVLADQWGDWYSRNKRSIKVPK